VHEQIGERAFAWQEGYAALTVSATARAAVREYIANQEEHHRQKTYREELIEMLERAGVEYDPRYLD
jgi:putative transposase